MIYYAADIPILQILTQQPKKNAYCSCFPLIAGLTVPLSPSHKSSKNPKNHCFRTPKPKDF